MMRIKVNLSFQNKDIKIPTNYRPYIYSIIKEAFNRSGSDGNNFLEIKVLNKEIKPYTYSVYLPIKKKIDQYFFIDTGCFSIFFSSIDYEFIMRLYNGLLNIKDFPIFDNKIKSVKCFILPSVDFSNKDSVVFKTLSPFLVRYKEDGDFYLVPEGFSRDKNFKYLKETSIENIVDSLKINIKSITKRYFDSFDNIEISLSNLSLSPSLHSSNRSNFVFTLPALKGNIKIKASPEILKLVYYGGIGARRSEGFGMLEVLEK